MWAPAPPLVLVSDGEEASSRLKGVKILSDWFTLETRLESNIRAGVWWSLQRRYHTQGKWSFKTSSAHIGFCLHLKTIRYIYHQSASAGLNVITGSRAAAASARRLAEAAQSGASSGAATESCSSWRTAELHGTPAVQALAPRNERARAVGAGFQSTSSAGELHAARFRILMRAHVAEESAADLWRAVWVIN